MAQKYASWAAKDTREASSLPTDFDGTIVDGKFTKEPPDNYTAEGNPIFAVVSILQDGSGPEQERTVVQSYSLGAKAGDEFSISDDGYGLIPTGDETAIRKGSKFDMFKCSLENEGVSQSVTESGDFSKLFGIRGHWKRIDDAKILGKEREFTGRGEQKKSKFPPQTLIMVKLLDGNKAAGKSNGAVAGTAGGAQQQQQTAPAAPAGDFDLDTATGLLLGDVLKNQKDHRAQRSQLTLLLSRKANEAGGEYEANRQAIAKRGADEAFLMELAGIGVVQYDPAAKPQYVTLPS